MNHSKSVNYSKPSPLPVRAAGAKRGRDKQARVVLLRHAHSQWNQENRFSGWSNPGLSRQGIAEATRAGRQLAAAGLQFDAVWRSLQLRTEQTTDLLLGAMPHHPPVVVQGDWRLNERHYGALEGMDKLETGERYGAEQVHRWRRGYYDRPPTMGPDDPRHPRFAPRYADVPTARLPNAENLADTEARVAEFWSECILPGLTPGATLLVVSHGNTLRALSKHLQGLSVAEVERLEIPTGQPLIYVQAAGGDNWIEPMRILQETRQ
jgi:2,3-bisphosphoglycerate-dependent phosphoglycerate mutase